MVYGTKQARQKAKKAHKGRSKRAKAADESKQAKKTLTANGGIVSLLSVAAAKKKENE